MDWYVTACWTDARQKGNILICYQYKCVLILGPHSFSSLRYRSRKKKITGVSHLFCQSPRQRGSTESVEVRSVVRGKFMLTAINITWNALRCFLLCLCLSFVCLSITTFLFLLLLQPSLASASFFQLSMSAFQVKLKLATPLQTMCISLNLERRGCSIETIGNIVLGCIHTRACLSPKVQVLWLVWVQLFRAWAQSTSLLWWACKRWDKARNTTAAHVYKRGKVRFLVIPQKSLYVCNTANCKLPPCTVNTWRHRRELTILRNLITSIHGAPARLGFGVMWAQAKVGQGRVGICTSAQTEQLALV